MWGRVYAVYLLILVCGASVRVAFYGVLELLFMAAIKLLLCTIGKWTHLIEKLFIDVFSFEGTSLSCGTFPV